MVLQRGVSRVATTLDGPKSTGGEVRQAPTAQSSAAASSESPRESTTRSGACQATKRERSALIWNFRSGMWWTSVERFRVPSLKTPNLLVPKSMPNQPLANGLRCVVCRAWDDTKLRIGTLADKRCPRRCLANIRAPERRSENINAVCSGARARHVIARATQAIQFQRQSQYFLILSKATTSLTTTAGI